MGLFISKKEPIVVHNEIRQIEEWTNMKVGNIIFDSDIDNWKQGTSIFDYLVMNKSNLIFLIEDDDNNLFGGYINARIDGYNIWLRDPKSFLFSLNSNRSFNKMLKFNCIQPNYSFYLYDQSSEFLFAMGGGRDIHIGKEPIENDSYSVQFSFNYNGIENALCGKKRSRFKPKRITVIQLI